MAIGGEVHVLGRGQEGLELGLGTEVSQKGQEQGEGVQAAGGQDLLKQQQVRQVVVCKDHVTHSEGLAPLVLGQVSKDFRCLGSSFT